MDMNSLLLSLVFGTVGLGFLLYGKNAGRLSPVAAGLGLMVFPYFVPNLLLLSVLCAALMAVPFVLRGV
jgi:hypothetical protein